ncbi:MAG TPA: Xaa-Pro peptidase family protein [Anaerolineales bacterium]|nr:Xaa-Pro peptidase family protein [Anaerolineales bacterium]
MHNEQRQRAQDLFRSRGLACALFANPDTVTWLTGYASPLQLGYGPFAGGPPLVWYEDGEYTLIVIDFSDTTGVTIPVTRYAGNTIDRPIPSADNLAHIIHTLAKGGSKLSVQMRHLPAFLVPPNVDIVPMDGWFEPLRMVKTPEELAKMRAAFTLSDLAHATAQQVTRAEVKEMDVWAAAHSAVQQKAGQRIPFGNDCVVSYRENNIGGWPGDLPLRPGDSLMVDISTRVEGYWSDSCNTYYTADLTERQKAMRRTAAEALEFAISLVKPGVPANEIDRKVRAFIADAGYPVYPHHTGHGIGVSPHEEPRIVPYNTTPLEPGMVIMLEPGIYYPQEDAVRLEDAILVTPDGAEILTKHLPR